MPSSPGFNPLPNSHHRIRTDNYVENLGLSTVTQRTLAKNTPSLQHLQQGSTALDPHPKLNRPSGPTDHTSNTAAKNTESLKNNISHLGSDENLAKVHPTLGPCSTQERSSTSHPTQNDCRMSWTSWPGTRARVWALTGRERGPGVTRMRFYTRNYGLYHS
ncbi:hypothetical protein VTK56DRAFT_3151 [Thermocarpiscus australiensis]